MSQKKLKILQILPTVKKGGAERVVCDLLQELSDRGHEVDLLLLHAPEKNNFLDEKKFSQNILIVQKFKNKYLAYFFGNIWAIRNFKILKEYDILHAHLTFASIFCSFLFVLFLIAGHKKTKIVETYHAVGMPISRIKRLLHLLLSRLRHGLILMAEDKYWSQKSSFYPCSEVRLIPNGIRLKDQNIAPDDLRSYIESIPGLGNSKKIIGALGQFRRERLPQTLLDLFCQLHHKTDNDVHYLFVGDGDLFLRCKNVISGQHLSNRIHLPGGTLNVQAPLKAIDIFITLSVGQLTGVAALEAVNAGCCVVALQLDPKYSCIDSDFIWSTTSIDKLIEKVLFYLSDDSSRKKEIDRQRIILNKDFNLDRMIKSYLDFYFDTI